MNIVHASARCARRYDILIALLLGVLFSGATYQGAKLIPSVLLTDGYRVDNVWFEGDTSRVFTVMTDKDSLRQARSTTHPLFALFSFPFVFLIKKVLHQDTVTAVRLVIAGVAFAWMFALFMLFRLLGCRRPDSTLFCLLAAVSAASMFYFVIPETFSFGSLTILLAFCMAVLSQEHFFPPLWYVLMNIATLSMTITNWMAGILTTVVNHPVGRTFRIIAYAYLGASVLWSVEKKIFPEARFFFDFNREGHFMLLDGSGGFFHVIKSFVYHTMIMPAIYNFDKFNHPDWPLMLTQLSPAGSATVWGKYACVLWTALLMLGTWALFFSKKNLKFRMVLGLMLAAQLGMHIVYGDETFLYSLHFVVLLVPLAALSCLTRLRIVTIALTGLLIPCLWLNNVAQFNQVLDFFRSHGTAHQKIRIHSHSRPQDPWLRGKGHVVLAYPTTAEKNKAYYEPGGSFSPSVGSFGVSIWVLDKKGNRVATSDSIPIEKIRQQFIPTGQPIPGILAETDYYVAAWSAVRPGSWRLDLKNKNSHDVDLELVVRSVGPAAGVVHSLEWKENRLSINGRWGLSLDPASSPYLGEETEKNWMTSRPKAAHWEASRDWGYARFPLEGSAWSLVIDDAAFPPVSDLRYAHTRSNLQLSLPDEEFVDSLNSQVAHLMMGTVAKETRPGDPMSYPVAWQREAAYTVIALAKAGQLDAARQLSVFLAEHDFFGGMGGETDGPGLTVWALMEVSDRLNDPEFDRSIWPHIRRKAEFIGRTLSTKDPIYESSEGRPLPKIKDQPVDWVSLVASPPKDGLIVGKVSLQYAPFYINAMSYLGLEEAASLADRMSEADEAVVWRQQASGIKQAWEKAYALSNEEITNPYTYNSGLWPSAIANDAARPVYLKNLENRWNKTRDQQDNFRYGLQKPYFAVGEAHQWLFLGDLDHTWRALRWFWKNQTSPGLYTWAEIVGEDGTYNEWEKIRGWVNPSQVTPHYGTAAEMLLLQLDMLGYLDQQSAEPSVVIGAGIPKEWLSSSLEVKGLSLPHRTVDWSWDGKQLQVTIHGAAAQIRLGPAFAPGTPVNVNIVNP